jgi:hypothetical protein
MVIILLRHNMTSLYCTETIKLSYHFGIRQLEMMKHIDQTYIQVKDLFLQTKEKGKHFFHSSTKALSLLAPSVISCYKVYSICIREVVTRYKKRTTLILNVNVT